MTDYLWAMRTSIHNSMDFYGFYGHGTDYTLLSGESEHEDWPEDAHVEAQAYSGKKLEDFATVQAHMMIVSPRAKTFLEDYIPEPTQLEFLPVGIRSSSGKVLRKTPYFALNVLELIDAELSDVPGIACERAIIRVTGERAVTLFERALSEAILERKLTGIGFGELAAYDRFTRF